MKLIEIQLNRDFCEHSVAIFSESVPLFYLNRDPWTVSLSWSDPFGIRAVGKSSWKDREIGKF